MNQDDMHSLVYSCMLAQLNGVSDGYGNPVRPDTAGLEIRFNMVFEVRPDRFEHNYQRNKFLHDRDRYISVQTPDGELFPIVIEKHRQHIMINKYAVDKAFGRHARMALDTMQVMFDKVYNMVEVVDSANIPRYDASAGMSPSNGRFSNEVR